MENPYTFVRWYEMLQSVLLLLIVKALGRKSYRWAFFWSLPMMVLGFFVLSQTLLQRLLCYNVPLGSIVNARFSPNQTTPALERARQVFLAHPYICAELRDNSAGRLVSQLMWRKINYGVKTPDPEARDAFCQQPHRAAYALTSMMDADEHPEVESRYASAEIAWASFVRLDSATAANLSRSHRIRVMADNLLVHVSGKSPPEWQEYKTTPEL